MKRVIALGALLVGGALFVAPSAGATPGCPPGTTEQTYCVPGLTLLTHTATATKGGVVKIKVHCTATPRCIGTLQFVLRSSRASALTSAAGGTIGSTHYSIASGHNAKLSVQLTRRGRTALGKTGKIKVSVVAVVSGKRTAIGNLTIKGPKTHHVTHAKKPPGFTG